MEESRSITLRTQFINGSCNVVMDSLHRRSQALSKEWTLHHEVCRTLWRLWGMPLVDLFATSQNFRLPTFVSPFPDPMAIAMDGFLFDWDHRELYVFPSFPAIRYFLFKLWSSRGTSTILIAPLWPRKEWFLDLLQVTVDTPHLLPTRPDLLRQPTSIASTMVSTSLC